MITSGDDAPLHRAEHSHREKGAADPRFPSLVHLIAFGAFCLASCGGGTAEDGEPKSAAQGVRPGVAQGVTPGVAQDVAQDLALGPTKGLPYRVFFSESGPSETETPGRARPWAYAPRAAGALPLEGGLLIAVNRYGALVARARAGGIALRSIPSADFATRTAKGILSMGGKALFHLYRNKTLDPAFGEGSGEDSLLLSLTGSSFSPALGFEGLLKGDLLKGGSLGGGEGWQLSGLSLGRDGFLYAERKLSGGDRVDFSYSRLAGTEAAGRGSLAIIPLDEGEFRAAFATEAIAALPPGLRELVQSLAGEAEPFCLLREAGRGDRAFSGISEEGEGEPRELLAWKAGEGLFLFDALLQAIFVADRGGIRAIPLPELPPGCRYVDFAPASSFLCLFFERGEWPDLETAGAEFIAIPPTE